MNSSNAGAMDTKEARIAQLNQVFTPAAPVTRRDLFAGRLEQIFDITAALGEPGRHVVLYGERGVGKTSLANLLADFLSPVSNSPLRLARVNCSTNDTYASIWTKVLREFEMDVPENWTFHAPDPDDVRRALGKTGASIVILDEFDRVDDDDAISLTSDTIKGLSDHASTSKVVLVGVADSIDQLVGDHESIQRAIAEVAMPRMSQPELVKIIDTGLAAVEVDIEDAAKGRIVRLAEGLPHYTHLITRDAALRAIQDDRDTLSRFDVEDVIGAVVERHSLLREYQTAVQSSRDGTLFAHVLAAGALAEKDRLGYFTSRAVREPLSRITGRDYEISAFQSHLTKFTQMDRGSVLKREGYARRYTYRFRNPLLQPFAVLSAIADGLIPQDYLEELFDYEPEAV